MPKSINNNMHSLLKGYKSWLALEQAVSAHTLQAYLNDIQKLLNYIELQGAKSDIKQINTGDISQFIAYLHELGLASSSQARIISGLRSFFTYLRMEKIIENDPTETIEMPKTGRKLPEVLSVEEIDKIVGAIDLSLPEGHRNKAIIETLYGCGLRVSELINLKISSIYAEDEFIRIIGKGNKERIIPISKHTLTCINLYTKQRNAEFAIKKGHEDILFLSRQGRKLSRQMIFIMIRKYASLAGVKKQIGPHTFRHSFATHLIDGGADLRAIQEMLGHASITTTEIYTHLDRHFLRDTIIQYHPRS